MKKEIEYVQKQIRIECAKKECESTLLATERKSGKLFGTAWFSVRCATQLRSYPGCAHAAISYQGMDFEVDSGLGCVYSMCGH